MGTDWLMAFASVGAVVITVLGAALHLAVRMSRVETKVDLMMEQLWPRVFKPHGKED